MLTEIIENQVKELAETTNLNMLARTTCIPSATIWRQLNGKSPLKWDTVKRLEQHGFILMPEEKEDFPKLSTQEVLKLKDACAYRIINEGLSEEQALEIASVLIGVSKIKEIVSEGVEAHAVN